MSVKRLGVSRFGLNCKKIYFRNGDQREFEKKKMTNVITLITIILLKCTSDTFSNQTRII